MHRLPAVHRFLSDRRIALFEPAIGRNTLKRAVNAVLEQSRHAEAGGAAQDVTFEPLLGRIVSLLETHAAEALTSVINGTGILLHTNLGRAPLARRALDAAVRLGAGYSNLEYDVSAGERGSRYSRLTGLLCEITGAQDAIVVNNCAAAVLLILDTFAKNREVVVSRNQLVEIGGGFRLPDVFARSGATLVEVGATNKVYLADFERALSAQTALLFRSHFSNFRMSGFTHDVAPADLAALGKRAGIPVVEDLGSGALVDLSAFGLPRERMVQDAVADGMALTAFSGDKLLGGPQAGIIAGTSAAVARLRNNPLVRALRVDKVTLTLLGETLRLYLTHESVAQIPFYGMLRVETGALQARAQRYTAETGAQMVETSAFVGGGSLPEHEIPSTGVSLPDRDGSLARKLRRAPVPVIGRNERGTLVLDLRTIRAEEDSAVIEALRA